jgi:hypothetical protein
MKERQRLCGRIALPALKRALPDVCMTDATTDASREAVTTG